MHDGRSAALLLFLLCACYQDIRFALPPLDAGPRTPALLPTTPPGTPDASGPPAADAAVATGCAARSPTLADSVAAADGCMTSLAHTFRYALCTCDTLSLPAPFESDAFDSASAPYAPGQGGASVATNAHFAALAPLVLRGSGISSGEESSSFSAGTVQVTGNWRANGTLNVVDTQVTFERDVWTNSIVMSGGWVTVAGVTYQPPGSVSVGIFHLGGGLRSQAYEVAPPCPCDVESQIDFARAASGFAAHNDNAALGLQPDTLRSPDALTRALPCGRYQLAPGRVSGARWRVSGRAAIFVDGDLELAERFEPDLGQSAELDVFVRGTLTLAPGASVGTRDRPAALRFFVGGGAELDLGAVASFAANVYAPASRVVVNTERELFGSLVVADYRALAHSTIHYDRAVLAREPGSAICAGSIGAPCNMDLDCEEPWLCVRSACAAHTD